MEIQVNKLVYSLSFALLKNKKSDSLGLTKASTRNFSHVCPSQGIFLFVFLFSFETK